MPVVRELAMAVKIGFAKCKRRLTVLPGVKAAGVAWFSPSGDRVTARRTDIGSNRNNSKALWQTMPAET
jgi:hypothetical protein